MVTEYKIEKNNEKNRFETFETSTIVLRYFLTFFGFENDGFRV